MQMPVCLSKNVIVQERLTSNPEYWASNQSTTTLDCDDGSDQFKSFIIIRPEWIQLKQEIGEGCFGKVFKGSFSPSTTSFAHQSQTKGPIFLLICRSVEISQ